jgi:hypothetical protein
VRAYEHAWSAILVDAWRWLALFALFAALGAALVYGLVSCP